jgi:hypothetical protein
VGEGPEEEEGEKERDGEEESEAVGGGVVGKAGGGSGVAN